jgi:3-keto-L-gulonate-6-phosphate decarboxylase
MIQLYIEKTSKGYSPKDRWQIFDNETKSFNNIKEAKDYLKGTYGDAKKSPMFVDDKQGVSHKVGYIFGFRNEDCSHRGQKWLQQDWVEFRKVKTINL